MRKNLTFKHNRTGEDTPASVGPGAYSPSYENVWKQV